MKEEWAKEFMQALEEKVKTYATETLIKQDPNNGLWFLHSFLPVFPEYDVSVFMQTMLFEARKDVQQVEILFVITNDVKEGTEDELEKALHELNYISPIGAFGLRRNANRLYLRDCLPIINEADINDLADKVAIYHGMMLEGLQGGYVGLFKIWNGEITYEQAVEEGLLNRAND